MIARAANAMVPIPFQVSHRYCETADTVTLEIEPVFGGPMVFRPGQFNMLSAFGVGEAAISISSDAAVHHGLTHTIRSVGAVTNALSEASPGTVIGVRGPFGTGWPLDEARGRDVVFVAGGIGLAPLRPAILGVLASRASFGDVTILYGARSPADLLFAGDLHAWRARFDLDVEITVDRGDEDWRGDVGVVTRFLPAVMADVTDPIVMVCGPEIMMQVVADRLVDVGVDSADVYMSMERNMKCGIGHCGHCQFGPDFVCMDGPVFPYSALETRLRLKGI